MKFVGRQTEVDAVQFNGSNQTEIRQFTQDRASILPGGNMMMLAPTAFTLHPGDWVAKDPRGRYHVIADEDFQGEFKPVE